MFPKNIKIRHTLAVIPALIFWVVSAAFFILGLSFDDQTGWMLYIGVALAVANTIIQFIGWDSDPSELGPILYWSWLASYVLGIGTNMVTLIRILPITNTFLEWAVAGSLSFLIEVTPERLFVLAWRSLSPKPNNMGRAFQGGENRRGPNRQQQVHTQYPPQQGGGNRPQNQAQHQKSQYKPKHKPQLGPVHQQGYTPPQQQRIPANQTQRVGGAVQPQVEFPLEEDNWVDEFDE